MDVIDDADDLVLLVAAAEEEAQALAAKKKRQKLSGEESREEGSYMAALRGSRSSLWQQQQEELKQQPKRSNPSVGGRGGFGSEATSGGNACFKCGMGGHWARDCTSVAAKEGDGVARGFSGVVGGVEAEMVAEKQCPCGEGVCLVLTSNTAKNPGRKFYRCPIKAENRGCNFFEWCDSPSSGISASKNIHLHQSNSSVPDLACPCGGGSCVVLVAKTGKNAGQQYYRCPANEGRGLCGFFKWCNEQVSASSQAAPQSRGHSISNNSSSQNAVQLRGHSIWNNSGSQQSSERNSSSCFKCGLEGHWAKDCQSITSDSYADDAGSHRPSYAGSGSGTCFKCGKAGHWARNCTDQNMMPTPGRKC